MRKILSCFIALAILILTVSCGQIEGTDQTTDTQQTTATEQTIDEPQTNYFDMKTDEAKIVEDFFNATPSFASIVFSKLTDLYPKNIFSVFEPELIIEFDSGKSLKDLIDEKRYAWICLTETGQIVEIWKGNIYDEDYNGEGEYKISTATMDPISDIVHDGILNKDIAAEVIKNSDIKQINEIYIAGYGFCLITFVIIESDSGEYVIPFCARPDFSHLENGKLYTAKEAIDTLREWYLSMLLPEE